MYDDAPACRAMSPPLCDSNDVFSDYLDRQMINDINVLRFGPS